MTGPGAAADTAAPAGPRVGEVLLGAAGACGIELPGEDTLATAQRLGFGQARQVCVVLVDGLGWHNLADRAGHAPFLAGTEPAQARATFPSTTATNLAYLGTGREGGQTGMLGYTVRDHDGRLLNLVSWNRHVDPLQWQPVPTVFERMAEVDRVAVSVGPWRFAESGLTLAALRGSEYSPAQSLAQRVDSALSHLRDPEVDLVYLYWGEVDSAGHQHGWRSQRWTDELRSTDAELDRLARRMPPGTLLVITADHGMVDVPLTERTDVAEHAVLSQDVDLVAGEPRAVHLYTRPARAEAVARRWQDLLGDRAEVLTREQVIGADLVGPVAPAMRRVIGDVLVIARGQHAIQDTSAGPVKGSPMIGMHGARTEAEMTVPLITISG
ncbi:MAG TPA: alkaline phosphatase family protein [Candidatus Ruania gallistercoris]|uniref:Alkaline phosphatase family protein n=1 Tax=Candidatus Ruania gallistercoris TaxID=2838746 RepID=A0A9D2EHR7_9MICO|nr:alkaline phosphatase family protein [Candidatus Ruania gallistercoris]